MYCECNCGAKTNIATHTAKKYGRIKGSPTRYIRGHNSTGREKGVIPWNKGLTKELDSRVIAPWLGKIRPNVSGENNYQWISDRTLVLEKHRLRSSQEWKNWRTAVFVRDNFTCKDCAATKVYVEPHHIVPIRSDRSKLFDITNGITLCRPCHKKTVWKEAEFADKYTALLTIA